MLQTGRHDRHRNEYYPVSAQQKRLAPTVIFSEEHGKYDHLLIVKIFRTVPKVFGSEQQVTVLTEEIYVS